MNGKLKNWIDKKKLSFNAKKNKFYLEQISKIFFVLGKRKNFILCKNLPNPNDLEDLTPFIIEEEERKDNLQTYLKSLHWGVLNPNVKNVAVSGSFGTGKSTVLNLFKKKFPEFKTLDINLGKFEEKNEQTEVDIETSIVQQILYFEKKDSLNDSRFERIKQEKNILLKAIFYILWIYSVLYIFFDSIYNKIVLINADEKPFYRVAIKIIFIAGVFFILKKLLRQVFKLKINKVSFSDAEFVPKENDISIINKQVDELIYFFEKTKTQIVFVEDIDRFEDAVGVFIKLRELNIIINNSKDISQKVTFVYAVKDELFSKNNEKTKFFDLIIPIIPVIDYSNSKTQFIKRLKNDFINTNIVTEDIINDISPYVNDMRSLINIINEFKSYHKIKSKENSNINGDKLFALIVLKNIYPNEFKSLQNKEGVIYKIFENKPELYTNIKVNIFNKIETLQNENKGIINEKQESVSELQKIYLSQILVNSFGATRFQSGTKNINVSSLLNSDDFDQIVASDNLSYYKDYSLIKVDFNEIEKQINTNLTYKERRDNITKKLENKKETNNNEITKLNSQIINLKNSLLYELIEQSERIKVEEYFNQNIIHSIHDIDIEEDYEKHKKIEMTLQGYILLKVLISNNYIDENYSNYISLFYPESISEKDNNLKLRIIQGSATEFNESIDKIRNFISELSSSNFKKESILNFQILDYLIGNYTFNNNVKNKLDEFTNTIISKRDKSVDFIEKYIDYSEISGKVNLFIKRIAEWDGFWNLVYSNEKFSNDKKKKILDKLISYIDINQIKLLNKDKKINSFLNNYDDFLLNNSEKLNKEDIINKLKVLGIRFNKIRFDNSILYVLSEINKNNLYKINPTNVNLFLDKLNTNEIAELDYNKSNYSFLLKSNVNHLKDNIKNNINEYVEQVMLKLENNINEEYDVVIELINNKNIKSENIDLLIEKLNFKISNISEIENSRFWPTLMIWEKIESNWKNVLLYYKSESEKIDDVLIEFLNFRHNFEVLSDNCINNFLDEEKEIEPDTIEKFNVSLVNSAISEESFNNLVRSITKNFDDASVIERSSRINSLIENNLIVFNNRNLSELTGKDLELFAEKNEEELKNSYDSLVLLIYTWITILTSNISGFLKKQIFDQLTQEKSYGSEDEMFLIKVLINFYEQKFHSFSEYFLNCVVKSTLHQSAKIRYLNFDKEYISVQLMNESIDLVGNPYSKVLNKEKFELPNTDENAEVLKNLQQMGYIKRTYLRDKDSKITVSYHD